jgi:flagellar hook-associated protein 3 FlgL
MMLRNSMQHINENRERLNDAQMRIASQKKVERPSDDPLAYSRSSRFRVAYNQNEQMLKNLADADSWMQTSSQALDQLYEYMIEAKGLATQGADGKINAEQRDALAQFVRGIMEEAVALSNSQYLGKSIFAGTDTTNGSPFALAADVVAYSGNDNSISRLVSENMPVSINVTGQDIMDSGVFTALSDLVTALDANDVTAIQTALDEINTSSERLLTVATNFASQQSTLEMIETRLTASNLKLASYISEEEDAVLEEEIFRYKAEETAYQAALQTTSQIMNLSIMEFMAI